MVERLQKIISAAGMCSRRRAEEYIAAGKVAVNGATANLGDSADPDRDIITLDGEPVVKFKEYTYIMLNKPEGVVTTMSDERGRRTVRDLTQGVGVRVYPVGRLDINSSGLLIMTDDGELANRLTHPRYEVRKLYLAGVRGDAATALPALRIPMTIDGEELRAARVDFIKTTPEGAVLRFTIREGKNRQIRRMCAAAGLDVMWLRRVAEGKIQLGSLGKGEWRRMTPDEIVYLKSL